MTVSLHMLEARPDERGVDHATLSLALDALAEVTLAATTCADSCLAEDDVSERTDCIRACADAADAADALGRILGRTGPTVVGTRALVDATAKLLGEVAEICGAHGVESKHCRICAETLSKGQQALAALQTEVASVAGAASA